VPKLVCVAKYESGFFEGATHLNTNGSTDYGLFQINDRYWLKPCGATGKQLLDGATNARCAKVVFDKQGLNAWATYKKRQAECDAYQLPPGPGEDPDGSSAGSCFSPTLGTSTSEGECVLSAKGWYQCMGGKWYSGAAKGSGPAGNCTSRRTPETG
jgi:hypothetical protein